MICDNCKHVVGEGPSLDYPYPVVWCAKGHWEGDCACPEPEIDPWADCKDFVSLGTNPQE